MAVATELRSLDEGDIVQGGTFMEALDPAPIDWLVVVPYDEVSKQLVVEAHWNGVFLGEYVIDSKGCRYVG